MSSDTDVDADANVNDVGGAGTGAATQFQRKKHVKKSKYIRTTDHGSPYATIN